VSLTPTARQRLSSELTQLTTELDDSRSSSGSSGDSADLAETSQGVERRRNIEKRIKRINGLLDTPDATPASVQPGTVHTGCAVTLRYPGELGSEEFWVGELDTSDGDMDVITPDSPLGQALLGSRQGSQVEYQAPSGIMSVEVVGVK
jgi:transcription elongation factor GreA